MPEKISQSIEETNIMERLRQHKKKIMIGVSMTVLFSIGYQNADKLIKFGDKTNVDTEHTTNSGMGSTITLEPDPNIDKYSDNANTIDTTPPSVADTENNSDDNHKSGIKNAVHHNSDQTTANQEKKTTPEKITPAKEVKNKIPKLVESGEIVDSSTLKDYLQKNNYLNEYGLPNPDSGMSQEDVNSLIKFIENLSPDAKLDGWIKKYIDFNNKTVTENADGGKDVEFKLNNGASIKFRTSSDRTSFSEKFQEHTQLLNIFFPQGSTTLQEKMSALNKLKNKLMEKI